MDGKVTDSSKMDQIQSYDYRKNEKRRWLLLGTGILVSIVLFIIDIIAGERWIPLSKIMAAVFYPGTMRITDLVIINDIRIPRACMAFLAGVALGFSGGIMQTVLNNKLASPYTLGLSSAAGFGASVAITIGLSSIAAIGIYLIPFVSFLSTAAACYMIFLFGKYFNSKPDTMILGGIGLSFIFQALQSLCQYSATTEQSQNIVFWLFGSLARSNWVSVTVTLVILIIFIPYIIKDSWKLTALKLGEENAIGLGVDVKQLRFQALLAVSIITGIAVSFIGTIGFIGLVGPHIARLAVGEDQRYYLPASGVFGGIILSLASIISKIIVPGMIFPIGIITSVVGGPFFLFFIFAKKKSVIGGMND